MSNVRAFSDFSLEQHSRFDRNKIYYGFIHNFSSPHTRDAYTRDLRKFLQFLKQNFKHLDELRVEHAHMVAFKDYLLTQGTSPRTLNRTLATLWSFYDYLMDQDLMEKNPVERVKRFSIPKEVKTQDLSDQQVLDLLGAINHSTGAGKLHRALLTLFFTTGMRHREATHLKFKQLDEENGFTVLRYWAKGAQERVMPLNPKAEAALSEYLQWTQSQGYSMEAEDYIFRGTKHTQNRPLNPKSVNYIIKKYAKKIGVTGSITIHSARSTVIGMLLDKGHALERVADFVGHRDISMTKAYNKRRLQIHQSLGLDLLSE
jgi:integrase/recombinase XerD